MRVASRLVIVRQGNWPSRSSKIEGVHLKTLLMPCVRTVAFVAFLAVVAISLACCEEPSSASLPKPSVHNGEGWAILAPAEWTSLQAVAKPPMVLYLNGDGKGVVAE